jgi:hypothetical protein
MVSDNFRIAQHLRDRRPWPFVGLQDFLSFVAMLRRMQTCGAAAFEKQLWMILGPPHSNDFGFWQHLARGFGQRIWPAFSASMCLLALNYSKAGRFQS